MKYLLDTVAVIRHFSGNQKIGKKAKGIIENYSYNDLFYISVISLMEIMYLAERKRIPLSLDDTINNINLASTYSLVNLTTDIIRIAEKLNFYELHDRMILSTAKWLDVPIISSDERFKELKEFEVIWD
jgi:PIN domain nuclease of toxin-antitoxin system